MALLTVAEARTHIETDLSDAALQRLLDAAEAAITDAIGPVGEVSEMLTAGPGDLIMLSRRASAIDSITERGTELDSDDYEIIGSGRLVRRIEDGTNPDSRWRGRVTITYTPASDLERRELAQLELIRLELDFKPGVTSERIGEWSESYGTGIDYVAQRSAILAGLSSPFVML